MPTGQETMRRKIAKSKQKQQEKKQKANPKYKRVKDRQGKVYVVSSTDGGKTWSKPELYTSKEYKTGFLGRPLQKKKKKLKVNPKNHKIPGEFSGTKEEFNKKYGLDKKDVKTVKKKNGEEKVEKKNGEKKNTKKTQYKQVTKDELDKKIKERSKPKVKPDPLKDYRRGEGTKLGKDTRITKHLKKAGWTEDRLAAKRKAHAEWKAARKNKKQLKKNTGG